MAAFAKATIGLTGVHDMRRIECGDAEAERERQSVEVTPSGNALPGLRYDAGLEIVRRSDLGAVDRHDCFGKLGPFRLVQQDSNEGGTVDADQSNVPFSL